MSDKRASMETPLPGPSVWRFLLSTSDVLEGGQKVYIKDEKTGETRWCKTRILAHKEIIDEIRTPEPENALKYTIHRPTRGWYIHVRAHSSLQSRSGLRPMALTPDLLADPSRPDADSELVVQFPLVGRGKGKERDDERGGGGLREQDEYSFPPTPPIKSPPRSIKSPPPSVKSPPPSSIPPNSAASTSTTMSASHLPSPIHTDPLRSPAPLQRALERQRQREEVERTIPLVFAPLPPPTIPQKQPMFSRAYASGILRVLANTLFSPPRRSFILSVRASSPPSKTGGVMELDGKLGHALPMEPVPTPTLEVGAVLAPRVPVLTYEDTTPVLAVSKMTGVLGVDLDVFGRMVKEESEEGVEEEVVGEGREDGRTGERETGEDVGLLVATALAYLDFLGDREGYIAAANGG
ncbi:hypothetical protein BDV93DRAFT_522465 [Ceratobasidium sp. AG-I]|nr:hypothetical protein BDV93DRAFT_522465 [Ceratobasidium sp. AG-I]